MTTVAKKNVINFVKNNGHNQRLNRGIDDKCRAANPLEIIYTDNRS